MGKDALIKLQKNDIVLIALSIVLFSLVAVYDSLFWIIFIAFVPLIYVNIKFQKQRFPFLITFLLNFSVLFLFHYLSFKWVIDLNKAVLIAALIRTLVLLCFFLVFNYFVNRRSVWLGIMGFIFFWLSLEYIENLGQLALPLMSLGNLLAKSSKIIQWYEFTGVTGGSLWILLVNFSVYPLSSQLKYYRKGSMIFPVILTFIVVSPIIISFCLLKQNYKSTKEICITSIHPNTNCYNYKYNVSPSKLAELYIRITDSIINNKPTSLIIWPETAITGNHDIHKLKNDKLIQHIKEKVCIKHNSLLVSGAFSQESVKEFSSEFYEQLPFLHFNEKGGWFLRYNSSFLIDPICDSIEVHVKQKLVPFEERLPYPKLFGPFIKHFKSFGNFSFFIKDDDSRILMSNDETIIIAPLICFESAFSEYSSQLVKNGSNIIVVMLNEDWYRDDNLKGANMFHRFSIIRAIENRRCVARSSNGGITSLITHKGDVVRLVTEPKAIAIEGELPLINSLTFYTKHGDYIGKFSCLISLFILLYFIFTLLCELVFRINRLLTKRNRIANINKH